MVGKRSSTTRLYPNTNSESHSFCYVGKLPKAKGGVEFVIVAVYYFSKWVEGVPLKNARGEDVTHFLWKNILTRFGIPKILVSDNGPQFEGQAVADFLLRLFFESHPKEQRKLSPKWEGSYRIKRILGPGTYELEDLDGKRISRTWHASKVCKYYV
ncbi:hypothetical protein LIER_40844 [Lithospermum erythrorhizon]|uniref:Integrase catalytic domain-containing protein n=1 Tax=Lithospermum erythrorhizon TaxID=34254 RepID=A0AAV3R4H2_LITER